MLLATAVAPYIFEVSSSDLSHWIQTAEGVNHIKALKFIQFFNGLGLFIIPGLIYLFLIEKKPLKMKFSRAINIETVLLIIFIFISFYPLIGFLGNWNAEIKLPEYFDSIERWMKSAEEHAAKLTKVFLQMDTPFDLGLNLLLIAVMPAIGEELIFRGILQSTINEGNKNKHWGVWISAILFSAIHMQFYGFLPRMLLGALFGYLFLWSNNIWVPIFAHFLNNGFAVSIAYWKGTEILQSAEEPIDYGQSFPILILSLFLMGILLFFFRKYHFQIDSRKDLPGF